MGPERRCRGVRMLQHRTWSQAGTSWKDPLLAPGATVTTQLFAARVTQGEGLPAPGLQVPSGSLPALGSSQQCRVLRSREAPRMWGMWIPDFLSGLRAQRQEDSWGPGAISRSPRVTTRKENQDKDSGASGGMSVSSSSASPTWLSFCYQMPTASHSQQTGCAHTWLGRSGLEADLLWAIH